MGIVKWIIIGILIILAIIGLVALLGDKDVVERESSGDIEDINSQTSEQLIDNSEISQNDDVEIGEVI